MVQDGGRELAQIGYWRVGEMAWWLRTLVALAEDPGLAPNLILSSGLLKYQACTWYTDMHAGKTFTHIK